MSRLLLFSIVLVVLLFGKAKADIIIIDGKTFNLNSDSPLNQYPFVKNIKEKLISYRTKAYDDPCSDYNAEWIIFNNALYLSNIYSCNDWDRKYKTDLELLFKNDPVVQIKDGKVRATWFKGNIWVAKSEPIFSNSIWTTPTVYKAETRFTILNGIIINKKDFVYPPQNAPFGNDDSDARSKFITERINWAKIHDLKNASIRVVISFESGSTGKPEKVGLFKPVEDKILGDEAIRVISLMPWNAYYRHGEILKQPAIISVLFNEELRKKYSH